MTHEELLALVQEMNEPDPEPTIQLLEDHARYFVQMDRSAWARNEDVVITDNANKEVVRIDSQGNVHLRDGADLEESTVNFWKTIGEVSPRLLRTHIKEVKELVVEAMDACGCEGLCESCRLLTLALKDPAPPRITTDSTVITWNNMARETQNVITHTHTIHEHQHAADYGRATTINYQELTFERGDALWTRPTENQ